jgi:hypothetical protein
MPDFFAVAAALGSSEPWVVERLQWASKLVSGPQLGPQDWHNERRLIEAANLLEDGLREWLFLAEAYAIEIPDELEAVLRDLPEVIEFLEGVIEPRRGGGPTPDRRKRLCAFVCRDIWRELHGTAQPWSTKLADACEAYWRACGHVELASIKWDNYLTQDLSHP